MGRNIRNVQPGWQTVRFDQLAENIRDIVQVPADSGYERFVGGDHLDTDSLKIRRWGSTDDVEAQKLLFKKGHILFGKRNAYLRKVALADFDGVCSAHMLVLQSKPEFVLPEFFPFFMQTDEFWERALTISEGSMSPTIKWTTLARQEFVLPPKDEQRRIAGILWAAEETIERYLTVLDSFDNYQRILTAKLVREGLHHKSFCESVVGTIPCTWQIVELQQVADVAYGLTVNAERRNMHHDQPYLAVANVLRGKLDLTEIKTIGVVAQDAERFSLKANDVLVVEGHADVYEIGRAALWRGEIENCLHQNHILRVRCSNLLLPYYALSFLNSPRGRAYFRRMAKSTSGLNTINSTVLKEMLVPLPPIDEQRLIAKLLHRHDIQSQMVLSHLETAKQLKCSLLEKLLSQEQVWLGEVNDV